MSSVDIRKIFGENVKYYRKKSGMSQEQFAEKLEISPNHLSVIETGGKFVTYKLLERIVAAFDVMPAALFFTPGTASFDDTLQNKINSIIKEELETATLEISKRLAKLSLLFATLFCIPYYTEREWVRTKYCVIILWIMTQSFVYRHWYLIS